MLVTVANAWPVRILQHPHESKHALGTARIASLCLQDCELAIASHHKTAELVAAQENPILLYPGPDSIPLDSLLGDQARPLIVIDATWRKSRRMLLESPSLAKLPRYCLPSPPSSRYRIRREPNSQALSTLEAIVHSLALLEGGIDAFAPMLKIMDALVDEQIAQMGQDVYERNYHTD